MEVDGRRVRLAGGQTVHVPRGVIHSGANSERSARPRVLLFSPAGMERFFVEAGAPGRTESSTPPGRSFRDAPRLGIHVPGLIATRGTIRTSAGRAYLVSSSMPSRCAAASSMSLWPYCPARDSAAGTPER